MVLKITTIPASDKNTPMIADVVIAPNRPDNDVMFEHDASSEMSKKYTVEIQC